jgi:hypothetical protein
MGDVANGFEEEDLSTLYRVELIRAAVQHVDLSSFYLPAPPEYSAVEDVVAEPASLRALLADREFSGLLAALRGTELQVLFWLDDLRNQAALAIDLLEQELAR